MQKRPSQPSEILNEERIIDTEINYSFCDSFREKGSATTFPEKKIFELGHILEEPITTTLKMSLLEKKSKMDNGNITIESAIDAGDAEIGHPWNSKSPQLTLFNAELGPTINAFNISEVNFDDPNTAPFLVNHGMISPKADGSIFDQFGLYARVTIGVESAHSMEACGYLVGSSLVQWVNVKLPSNCRLLSDCTPFHAVCENENKDIGPTPTIFELHFDGVKRGWLCMCFMSTTGTEKGVVSGGTSPHEVTYLPVSWRGHS